MGLEATSLSLVMTLMDRRLEQHQDFSPNSHLFHSALQKLLAECQDQQWCQFSVHSQVFGPDPCPGTHKYLIASYKCRPGEVEHGLGNTEWALPDLSCSERCRKESMTALIPHSPLSTLALA